MKDSELIQMVNSQGEKIDKLTDALTNAANQRDVGVMGRTPPFARKGENMMSSRGFSFCKLLSHMMGKLPAEEAKIELEYCSRHGQSMSSKGYAPSSINSRLVPIWPDGFSDQDLSNDEYHEMKGLLNAGIERVDPDEYRFLQKRFGQKAAGSPAQSWIDQSYGGSFVAPPTFGPPIELLRNKEVFMSAGCRVIPLGPSGRIVFPRLNSATTGGWSGENIQATPTRAGTGQLSLSALKVIAVVVLPNESLRFSPAMELFVREDLMKTVALVMDKGLLDGAGGDTQPLGIATMGAASGNPYQMGIVTPTTANQLAPQDIYEFMSVVEENNYEPEKCAWIMRPKMKWAIYKSRASGDGTHYTNNFMFDWARGPDGAMKPVLAGCPIVSSVQVSNTRGSGAQTYVALFAPEDFYVAMFGSIELFSTDGGYTLATSDQSVLRAIVSCNGGPRHPGAVAFCDNLNFTIQ